MKRDHAIRALQLLVRNNVEHISKSDIGVLIGEIF